MYNHEHENGLEARHTSGPYLYFVESDTFPGTSAVQWNHTLDGTPIYNSSAGEFLLTANLNLPSIWEVGRNQRKLGTATGTLGNKHKPISQVNRNQDRTGEAGAVRHQYYQLHDHVTQQYT